MEDRPRWDRALDVFRSEAAAFRVLLVVAAVAVVVIAVALVAQAL
ncbi:hypothetical protein [Conexibacter sp. SYSU D00693]|nr:hypothetical protein [Conexibacter sp. SYSU D00693]